MSLGAALALEQSNVEEIVIEETIHDTQVSEGQEQKRPFPELSDQPMAAILNHLVLSIQAIEEQYAKSINAAVNEMMQQVHESIQAGSSANSPKTTQRRILSARNEFDEKVRAAAGKWNSQRQWVSEEIESLEDRWNWKGVLDEIARTEQAVGSEEIEIQGMVRNAAVDLGRVMRANINHNEMKAYLKGLKYRAWGPPSSETTGL